MSDPPRLLDESASNLSGRLLASAEGDGPPSDAKQRVLLSLGLAAGAATVGAGATAAASSSLGASGISATGVSAGGGVSAATSSSLGAATLGVLAKWTVTGAALAGLTITVARQVAPSPPHPPSIESVAVSKAFGAPRVSNAPTEAAPNTKAPPETAPVEDTTTPKQAPLAQRAESPSLGTIPGEPGTPSATRAVVPLAAPIANGVPTSAGARREPAPAPPTMQAEEAPSPTRTADLASEVSLLDVARDALSKGQIEKATAALGEYERLPAKTLAPEATLLRIEVLARKGEPASAARLARAFLAAHPSSAHAARVRTMLAALENSLAP